MGVAERSREHVEVKLEGLAETYGSFEINQTTLSLPGKQYKSMRERGNPDPVAAYIAVRNDEADVLHVDSDEEPQLPGVQLELDASLEPAVREAVQQNAGIDCTIVGVEHVTIAGLRNAEDPNAETLYNLVVVFSGEHKTGSPAEEASWQQLDEGLQPAYA